MSGYSNLGQEKITINGNPDKRFSENKSTPTTSSGEPPKLAEEKDGKIVTEGAYKPTEHGGLTKSGQPDKRLAGDHGFGSNKERASEAGRKGGEAIHPPKK